jgi:hypothetical protein
MERMHADHSLIQTVKHVPVAICFTVIGIINFFRRAEVSEEMRGFGVASPEITLPIGLASQVITVPVVSGLITDLDFDLVRWGIIMLVVVEVGPITPPFVINVFVLKAVAGAALPLATVFRGVMPFVAADMVKLVLLVLPPALVLGLPSTMFN